MEGNTANEENWEKKKAVRSKIVEFENIFIKQLFEELLVTTVVGKELYLFSSLEVGNIQKRQREIRKWLAPFHWFLIQLLIALEN